VPARCPITYTCQNVTPTAINCDDLTKDLTFNGDPTDGVISFNPSSTDYENGTYPPGVYTITIRGEVDDSGNYVDI